MYTKNIIITLFGKYFNSRLVMVFIKIEFHHFHVFYKHGLAHLQLLLILLAYKFVSYQLGGTIMMMMMMMMMMMLTGIENIVMLCR